MTANPLPEGNNASEVIRRLRAIDAEIFGSIYARAGTLASLAITGRLTGGEIVGSDIWSDNWNGVIPPSLASRDATASAGYALDGSSGGAQFVKIFADAGELKNLSVTGSLTVNGGKLTTATSGEGRLEVFQNGINDAQLAFYNSSNIKVSRLGFIYSGSTNLKWETFDGTSWATTFEAGFWPGQGDQLVIGGGNQSYPSLAGVFDPDTGIEWPGGNVINLYAGGNVEFILGATGFKVPNVYNSTIADAANVTVVSDGRLYRSTSTGEYKEDKRPWWSEGSILNVQPITFYPMSGNITKGEPMTRCSDTKVLGLTYENMKDKFPLGAQDDNKALDWNAIVTALLSEVATLKPTVTALLSEITQLRDRIERLEARPR